MRGPRRALDREVDAAHAGTLGSPDISDRVIADMGRVTRLGAEAGQGAAEYLGVGLAVTDFVGAGDDGEVTQEIVALEDLPQDDAGGAARARHDTEGDAARCEGPPRFVRPRAHAKQAAPR